MKAVVMALVPLIAVGALSACDKPNVARLQDWERPQIAWDEKSQRFASAGEALEVAQIWLFPQDADGFSGAKAELARTDEGLSVLATGDDPVLRTPAGLDVVGRDTDLLLVRLTRTANAPSWDGSLYFATNRTGEAAKRRIAPSDTQPPKLGETRVLVYDLGQPTNGGRAWRRSVIDQVRLDLDNEAGGAFVIRQIALVRHAD